MEHFQIGEGGLLRRFERATRLVALPRQIAATLAVAWLPLLLPGLALELSGHGPDAFVRDFSVHVRMLVAVPAFLYLDTRFPEACRRMLGQLIAQGFVPRSEKDRLRAIVVRATNVSNAVWPEILLALLAVSIGALSLLGTLGFGGLGHESAPATSRALYGLVTWPLFQFLLWRALLRWGVWGAILIGLSRLDLSLVPSHPDRRCGIRFLSQPSIGYCAVFLFAVSSVLAADLSHRLDFGSFESFQPLLVTFLVVGSLVAFGPLLAFVPMVIRAALRGRTEADGVASEHGRKRPRGSELMAHLTVVYRESVSRINPFLFGKADLLLLGGATLLPILPVMLSRIPGEDWKPLLDMVSGGMPG
jgi:hypothetical protein